MISWFFLIFQSPFTHFWRIFSLSLLLSTHVLLEYGGNGSVIDFFGYYLSLARQSLELPNFFLTAKRHLFSAAILALISAFISLLCETSDTRYFKIAAHWEAVITSTGFGKAMWGGRFTTYADGCRSRSVNDGERTHSFGLATSKSLVSPKTYSEWVEESQTAKVDGNSSRSRALLIEGSRSSVVEDAGQATLSQKK